NELPTPKKAADETSAGSEDRPKRSKPAASETDSEGAALPAPTPVNEVSYKPDQLLTLPDAIALAFRLQPRLRASLESINQAQGRQEISFAAFLPALTTGYSVGGFHLNAGGAPLPTAGLLPNTFNFIPGLGAAPFGLNINTGYELAELKLQWLVCDFG